MKTSTRSRTPIEVPSESAHTLKWRGWPGGKSVPVNKKCGAPLNRKFTKARPTLHLRSLHFAEKPSAGEVPEQASFQPIVRVLISAVEMAKQTVGMAA